MKIWRTYLPKLPEDWREVKEGIDGSVFQRTDGLIVYYRVSQEHDGRGYIRLHIQTEKIDQKLDPKDIEEAKVVFVDEKRQVFKVFLNQKPKEPSVCFLWYKVD